VADRRHATLIRDASTHARPGSFGRRNLRGGSSCL
jgi:hypothetical protein